MSLLVSELSQIIDRVTVVAPSDKRLHEFFEMMAFELTTKLGVGQEMDLQLAAPADGPIRSWGSFTLGRRGSLNVRITLMGTSLESMDRLSSTALEISDAFFLWLPSDDPLSDKVFAYPFSDDHKFKPTVIAGLLNSPNDSQHGLRAKALTEWAQRKFKRLHFVGENQTFLAEALEWVLSF